MAILERNLNGISILQIEGRLGMGGEEALHEHVQQRIAAGARHFVFDMTRVSHVDSIGIAALIGAHVSIARAGGRLILVGLNPRVTRVLAITRLLTVFESREREAEAIAHLIGPDSGVTPQPIAVPKTRVARL